MVDVVFTILVALAWRLVRESIWLCIRKPRAPTLRPVCADCFHAHVQSTANARRAISCTDSDAVRPMKLDVLCGTDYRA